MKKLILACYAQLLLMYPRRFRDHYGREMRLYVRDYARERGAVALGLLLFSDLMMSIPQQHYYEARMAYSRNTIIYGVMGGLLVLAAAGQLLYDAMNPNLHMGFLLVLVVTTAAVAGMYLLSRLRRRPSNFIWLIPVAYAAAASVWLLVTPRVVEDPAGGIFGGLHMQLLGMGRSVGIVLLLIPLFIAMLPVMLRSRQAATIAFVAMLAFIVLMSGMVGSFYIPAAITLIGLRVLSQRRMLARSAS